MQDVTVHLVLKTGFLGEEHEKDVFFDRAEWDAADKATRDELIRDEMEDFKNDVIDVEVTSIEDAAEDDDYKYGYED